MIVFVDGDNRGSTRLTGIEKLSEDDTLHIYYNGKNGYFTKQRIKEIKKASKCKVSFNQIKCQKNAVDFAIALDASAITTPEKIRFVSGDKDFETFCSLLRKKNPAGDYGIVESIKSATKLSKSEKEINAILESCGDFTETSYSSILV